MHVPHVDMTLPPQQNTTLTAISLAIRLAASQKTLPFSVTVIGFLPEEAGTQGLMVIACIVAHLRT